MLVLALVWWAWSAYVWVTNAQDPDSPLLRASLLLAGGVIFIAGLAVPQAYGSEGALFAITYVIVRFGHLGALRRRLAPGQRVAGRAIAGFGGHGH